jgi:hypothetical protein
MTITNTASVDAICDALVASRAKLSAVMRQITDPSPHAVGTWIIGETARHLSGSAEYFLAAARGEADLERLDEVDAGNARDLVDNPERDPRVLADRFDRGGEALVAYAWQVDGDPAVTPFAGVEVPFSTLLGVELRGGARTRLRHCARRRPSMAHRPATRRAGLAIDLRVRGMRPVVARIQDGTLTVDEAGIAVHAAPNRHHVARGAQVTKGRCGGAGPMVGRRTG